MNNKKRSSAQAWQGNRESGEILNRLVSNPKVIAFADAVQKLDLTHIRQVSTAMRRDFVWLSYHRTENTEIHNMLLSDLLCLYDGLARYLDSQGLNELVPFEVFKDFPYQTVSPCLAIESDLFMEAGMSQAEVNYFWTTVDKHKLEFIRDCAKGFRFQDHVLPRHLGYLGPKPGNSWIDRLVAGVAGVVAIGANIVGGVASTAASCGLAAPLAAGVIAVSVTAGVVGIGHAATGGLTP